VPPAHLICPTCGYNLTGLTRHVCPECGSAFDPEMLLEMPEIATREMVWRMIASPVLTLGWLVARGVLDRFSGWSPHLGLWEIAIVSFVLLLWNSIKLTGRLRNDASWGIGLMMPGGWQSVEGVMMMFAALTVIHPIALVVLITAACGCLIPLLGG
jgi:hypothetical protein